MPRRGKSIDRDKEPARLVRIVDERYKLGLSCTYPDVALAMESEFRVRYPVGRVREVARETRQRNSPFVPVACIGRVLRSGNTYPDLLVKYQKDVLGPPAIGYAKATDAIVGIAENRYPEQAEALYEVVANQAAELEAFRKTFGEMYMSPRQRAWARAKWIDVKRRALNRIKPRPDDDPPLLPQGT